MRLKRIPNIKRLKNHIYKHIFNNYPEPVRQILDKQSETKVFQKHDLYDETTQIICKSTYSIVRGRSACNDA